MNDSHRSYDSYDDGLVQLDRAAITLRRYHFPSGTSKVIALGSIRGYKAESLGLFTQRLRIWGSSDFRRWLPLDIRRPLRSTLITLDVPGTWPSPAFTPARPDEFTALLDELLAARGWRPRPASARRRAAERALMANSGVISRTGYTLGEVSAHPMPHAPRCSRG